MSKQHVPISMAAGIMCHLWNSTTQEIAFGQTSCLLTGPLGRRFVSYLLLISLPVSLDLQDTISEDPNTHGAMLISVVSGSDKTVASIATGHQEFHPLYISPGNIHNTARRAHDIGFLPCAFLPIPKGMFL